MAIYCVNFGVNSILQKFSKRVDNETWVRSNINSAWQHSILKINEHLIQWSVWLKILSDAKLMRSVTFIGNVCNKGAPNEVYWLKQPGPPGTRERITPNTNPDKITRKSGHICVIVLLASLKSAVLLVSLVPQKYLTK